MLKKDDIRIRDPFILLEGNTYYMYGTTHFSAPTIDAGNTFAVYTSKDLKTFDGPYVVFDGAAQGFWADRDYWAAEVWKYNNRFYLFGSFKADDRCRATHILVADSPMGPFAPLSEKPQTPASWECLDGTLYVEDGVPYMVFCHEWLQVEDGQMCAIQLSEDLSTPVGEPFMLFRASDNPQVDSFAQNGMQACRITDGPHVYREGGRLHMIWSSLCDGRYAVLEATADSLRGPWEHHPSRFTFDGGHAMLFTDKAGDRRIALHHPNTCPDERALFLSFS